MNKEDEERALHLHRKSIIIDALECFFPVVTDVGYFDELIKAGVTAINATVFDPNDTHLQAVKRLKNWYKIFDKHGDKVVLAATGGDIEKAKVEGKVGIVMGSQNADMIGDDLSLLEIYKRLGLRIIQLSYYRQNLLGEGCSERTDGGLSMFGIEVVEEMNRLSLLIDVSHCKDQVTMDAIRYSKAPVIASHANPRGLINHIRNKTDEQIKALAEKGGVMGLNSVSLFSEVRKGVRATFEDFISMVDYVVRLVGPDHVGLGLDNMPLIRSEKDYEEWAQPYPDLRSKYGWKGRGIFTNDEGWDDITQLAQITKGLVAHGYSDQDIERILGLNFLRVFKEVWGE